MEKVYEKILEKIPDTIDFSFITVKNETFKTFSIENPSEFSVFLKIESANTYIFEPNHIVLKKKQKTDIKVKITPETATVIIASAIFTLDEKSTKVVKLSSIAKYPYLRISGNVLDFGNVLIGKSKENEIIIHNPEKVPARFEIKKETNVPGRPIEQFFLSSYKGEIPPSSSFLINVKYVTTYPNFFSYETFQVKTKGGNVNRFSCLGNCLSLNTYPNAKNVNFGSIELTAGVTKLIRIFNDSEVATPFQFFHSNDGPFIINDTQGIIEPKSNVRVHISFRPNETMIYYDRVFCLIKNHFLYVRKNFVLDFLETLIFFEFFDII
jgi:hypothetical protein